MLTFTGFLRRAAVATAATVGLVTITAGAASATPKVGGIFTFPRSAPLVIVPWGDGCDGVAGNHVDKNAMFFRVHGNWMGANAHLDSVDVVNDTNYPIYFASSTITFEDDGGDFHIPITQVNGNSTAYLNINRTITGLKDFQIFTVSMGYPNDITACNNGGAIQLGEVPQ